MSDRITEFIKGQIIAFSKNGLSSRNISAILDVSKSTINRIILRWNKEGSLTRKKGCGRPKAMNRSDHSTLLDIAESNSLLNSRQINHELKKKTGLVVSKQTIKRNLNNLGLFCRVAREKTMLFVIIRRLIEKTW